MKGCVFLHRREGGRRENATLQSLPFPPRYIVNELNVINVYLQLETQLLILLAVSTAAAAAAAASELLHRNSAIGMHSDLDYDDSHEDLSPLSRRHDLHKRAPKDKGKGLFFGGGFTFSKKSLFKTPKIGGKGFTSGGKSLFKAPKIGGKGFKSGGKAFKTGGKALKTGGKAIKGPSKGFKKGSKFGGGKKAAKGFGGLSSGFIRTGNDDGDGGALSGLISNLPGGSFDGSAVGGRGFRFGGGGGDDDDN